MMNALLLPYRHYRLNMLVLLVLAYSMLGSLPAQSIIDDRSEKWIWKGATETLNPGFLGGSGRKTMSRGAFGQTLRRKLGGDKLILADCTRIDMQRNYSVIDGIEAEGFPAVDDFDADKWSQAMNRMRFWMANNFGNGLSYINFKYRTKEVPTVSLPPEYEPPLSFSR